MPSSIHHLSIAVSNLRDSTDFYSRIFGVLGYTQGLVSDDLCTWHGPEPELLVYQAERTAPTHHQLGEVGWHHAAFQVSDRSKVDSVHAVAAAGKWQVVHPPREYPEYSDGYYAVFIEDPSGIRYEFMTIPESDQANDNHLDAKD